MQVGQIVSNVHRLFEVGWVLFLMYLGSFSMAISEESTMPRRELSKSWHRRSRRCKLVSLSRANPARFVIIFHSSHWSRPRQSRMSAFCVQVVRPGSDRFSLKFDFFEFNTFAKALDSMCAIILLFLVSAPISC